MCKSTIEPVVKFYYDVDDCKMQDVPRQMFHLKPLKQSKFYSSVGQNRSQFFVLVPRECILDSCRVTLRFKSCAEIREAQGFHEWHVSPTTLKLCAHRNGRQCQ